MEISSGPLRCPKCNALVVDRRSPVCTTCRAALPKEWIMSSAQADKLDAMDRAAKAEHAEEMKALNNPWTQPVRLQKY